MGQIRKMGDKLLSLLVPSVEARAGSMGANAVVFCYCRNRQARYKNCNGSICGGCNLVYDC